jgi:glyoxylase-like metal-dependent hydrolase (beta-lactamase superfamily II)
VRDWKSSCVAAVLAGAVSLAGQANAQFEPPTIQRGPKLAPVTVYPAPGTYTNTTGITLRAPDDAIIHYSLDGTRPTEKSPTIDAGQVLFINGIYDGDRGLKSGYTIRAVATKAGRTDGDPATFSYMIERRDRTSYVSEEVAPGVRMIRDSDNDKMFLIRGSKAFALIDTGMGRGALRDYVAGFTGGLPVIVILTHMHGDHIGQAGQFIDGSTEYVGTADREAVAQFITRQGASAVAVETHLKPVEDGARIDLGDRALEIHAVPGHTPGSIAILDTATGNLFTGDTFGNNSPLPPDVMWMQGYKESLDVYLANVRLARTALGGRVKRIFTGHNDRPLEGVAFLDNLETAIQKGLDEGDAALIPSWRPAGIVQLVEGDRFTDPNWFGVNVNRATFMPAPAAKVAGLTGLAVAGGTLSPRFTPAVHDYVVTLTGRDTVTVAAIPTSTHSHSLRIGGRAAKTSVPVRISPRGEAAVEVVSPDGTTMAAYHIRFSSERPRR